MTRSHAAVLGFAALSFISPNLALADHCDKAEADIKDICSRISPDQQGWHIAINYKVKIEDAHPGQQFDLVMALTQKGCQIVDESGREVIFVVPLVFPNTCKDKFVFCNGLQNIIGRCNITCPNDLKIAARVIDTQTGKVLDCEKEGVKFSGCVTERVVVEQPAPVVVQPAPVIVRPAPVVVQQVAPVTTVRRVVRRVYYPAPVRRQVSVQVNAGW